MSAPAPEHIPADDAAPALIGFVACTLAVALLVVWLGSDATWPILVVAIAAVLAVTALGAVGISRLLRDEPVAPKAAGASRWAGARRFVFVPLVALPLVVGGALLLAPRPRTTPIATVRDFLTAAVVDTNGQTACTYLTAEARVDFEGPGLSGPATCQSFFGGAMLRLGGVTVASRAQLDRLDYAVTRQGRDRLVTASYHGQSIRFELWPANGFEVNAFHAPDTPWRIASAVNALGTGPFASAPAARPAE
jgi:hypothetical protein